MRFAVFAFVAFSALSQGAVLPDKSLLDVFPSLHPREGIAPAKIGRFWEKWHAVTTRYRADIGELRFTYANDAAWKALVEQSKEFPDGAQFAKIATALSNDPAFPGSATPDRVVRIQLMRKEKDRYRTNDGWGYALYTDGAAHPDDATTSASCHACHTVVRDRDFVFSQPAFRIAAASTTRFAVRFHEQQVAALTHPQKLALGRSGLTLKSSERIRVAETPMFAGSLSELLPALAKLVDAESVAHLAIDPKNGLFVAGVPAPQLPSCKRAVTLAFSGSPNPNALSNAHPAGAQDPAARVGTPSAVHHKLWCDGKTSDPR